VVIIRWALVVIIRWARVAGAAGASVVTRLQG
jgi:hypothetical protein